MKRLDFENGEEMQPVMLVTDDAEFRRRVVGLWQSDVGTAAVVPMAGDAPLSGEISNCDLVILGPVHPENLACALAAAASAPAAVAFLPAGIPLEQVRWANRSVVALHVSEDSAEVSLTLGRALLQKTSLGRQLERAEAAARARHRNAELGRYMLDSRHDFSNALTSVLGTAELLLLNTDHVSSEIHDRARTIHAMAMQMYHTIVRFTSLETELRHAEAQSGPETIVALVPRQASSEAQQ